MGNTVTRITQADFARRKGVSRKTISTWIARGLPRLEDGMLDLAEVEEFCAFHDLPRTKRHRTGGETLTDVRLRKEAALARKHELEVATREGKLLPRDLVLIAGQRIMMQIRTHLLSLPTKAAPMVLGLSSTAQIESVLRDHVHEAMTELARLAIDMSSAGEGR